MILSTIYEIFDKEYISHDEETRYNPSFYNELIARNLSSNEHRKDNDREYQSQEELMLSNYRKSINYADNIKYNTNGHLDIVEK